MSVIAKIKMDSVVVMEMCVQDVHAVFAWMEKHHGEYNEVKIIFKSAGDLRQGREP